MIAFSVNSKSVNVDTDSRHLFIMGISVRIRQFPIGQQLKTAKSR